MDGELGLTLVLPGSLAHLRPESHHWRAGQCGGEELLGKTL